MKVNIKRFCPEAPKPERKTEGAAGYDLPVCAERMPNSSIVDSYGYRLNPNHEGAILLPLGWGFEIPRGYVGLLEPRSSTSHWLHCGRIDSDYRGQVFVKTTYELLYRAQPTFKFGDRIAQLIIVPFLEAELEVVEEFATQTARGAGGHGSTGR